MPIVLDADALNHLVGALDRVADSRGPVVMTPHPGEAARLLGTSAGEVERDRVAAVRALAERTRAVVVLKGARHAGVRRRGGGRLRRRSTRAGARPWPPPARATS